MTDHNATREIPQEVAQHYAYLAEKVVTLFDADATAGSFLREDGEGGFASGISRMAREIDRLRAENAELNRRLSEEYANMDATMKGWDALCAKSGETEEKLTVAVEALKRIVEPAPGVSQKAPAWVCGIAKAAIKKAEGSA